MSLASRGTPRARTDRAPPAPPPAGPGPARAGPPPAPHRPPRPPAPAPAPPPPPPPRDARPFSLPAPFGAPDRKVYSLNLSADCRFLAGVAGVTSMPGVAWRYDLARDRFSRILADRADLHSVRLSPDGKRAYATGGT